MCGSWLNKIQHSYRMDTMHPLKEADIYILKIHCLLKKQAENSISIIRCEDRIPLQGRKKQNNRTPAL